MNTMPYIRRYLRSESTKLEVYIPQTGNYTGVALRYYLGPRTQFTFDRSTGICYTATKHLLKLSTPLAEYFGACDVYLRHKKNEYCTGACRSAESERFECVCICLGRDHGGRQGESENTTYIGDMIIDSVTIESHHRVNRSGPQLFS